MIVTDPQTFDSRGKLGEVPPSWLRLPYAADGNRIGLFGGSFNPPHPGHFLVAETALRRLELDQIWWLVTPGNPLKSRHELTSLEERVCATKALARHPRMKVTAFEAVLGTSYTASTLKSLRRIRPRLNFVWVMGADNLANFHHWQNWQSIIEGVPVAIVDRPKATLSSLSARVCQRYAFAQIKEESARQLPECKAPCWTILHGPLDETSSTLLRDRGHA
ncbi:nicotinate-nucleotide adenylyltransferase [Pseudovibrio sp. Tun.PSC04-5.I4]|uniref:nicotinate-nucleotide adenylyltransferase n=1 Tax=Pseudovibrio sp. Tun.PSC04-5.I4 TaxID=1798213 RepID=UPI000880CDDF|nr:nicotinate-nucleotide adenylyltransferase [Pseudovibrio sp. Tun.PSC04-5.I4]SDR22889.1 nicotinate-nucleotide adenylyltransferase [Pseudovibrio sp. Tun.PSC04-5.I4]